MQRPNQALHLTAAVGRVSRFIASRQRARKVATQRLTIATLAGQAAVVVADQFQQWRDVPVPDAVDRLCAAIREHALSLPVVLGVW